MERIDLARAVGNVAEVASPVQPGVKAPNSDAFLNVLEKAGKAVAAPQLKLRAPATISPIIWKVGFMRPCW